MPRFSDEQIRAIVTRPTKPRVIDFPGRPEIKIAVKCLDDVELDGCRIEAQRRIRDIAKKRQWEAKELMEIDPVLMERFVEREIILRSYFDPDTVQAEKPIPFFANEHELVQLGSVGVTDLMEAYNENQEWQNPSVSLSEEEEVELIERLGKAQNAEATLTGIALITLRRLLISSAKRLNDYRTGRSSTSNSSAAPTPSE